MTNFEKWKADLTPEDIFTNYGIFEFCGKLCPAEEYCKKQQRFHIISLNPWNCKEVFFEWANKETE
jgi:hypothetical protein